MTDDLHLLQHSLGVDKYGQGRRYRNHFVTGPDSDDFAGCRRLVDAGLMIDHGTSDISGGMHTFTVTAAGGKYVTVNSPAPPKITRSQKRYRDFLQADCGMTFFEYLKATMQAGKGK